MKPVAESKGRRVRHVAGQVSEKWASKVRESKRSWGRTQIRWIDDTTELQRKAGQNFHRHEKDTKRLYVQQWIEEGGRSRKRRRSVTVRRPHLSIDGMNPSVGLLLELLSGWVLPKCKKWDTEGY